MDDIQRAIEALSLKGGIEITGKLGRVAEFFNGLETAISAMKELQQYRQIGTLEECWEARKKQQAKKPDVHINPTDNITISVGITEQMQQDLRECITTGNGKCRNTCSWHDQRFGDVGFCEDERIIRAVLGKLEE